MTISHTNSYLTHDGMQYRRYERGDRVVWWTDPEDGGQAKCSPLQAKKLESLYQGDADWWRPEGSNDG